MDEKGTDIAYFEGRAKELELVNQQLKREAERAWKAVRQLSFVSVASIILAVLSAWFYMFRHLVN